uniref:Putative ovule protein n=1 Tax=Solanum chacoense TaxID=4108 RepID=A0A0V0GI81_SOLCH
MVTSFSAQHLQQPSEPTIACDTVHFPLPNQPCPCQPPPPFLIALCMDLTSHFLFPTLEATLLLNHLLIKSAVEGETCRIPSLSLCNK